MVGIRSGVVVKNVSKTLTVAFKISTQIHIILTLFIGVPMVMYIVWFTPIAF